jgi:SAM-dependent methyltransferase
MKNLSFLERVLKRLGLSSGQIPEPAGTHQSISRTEFFGMIGDTKNILEIGKLSSPVFRQSKNIDIFSRAELIEYYRSDKTIDPQNIGEVDFVIKNNDWTIIDERFDYLVTSHNIEHMPCLVNFFRNCNHVLKDDGKIFAVIPDYRYCFDTDKIPSTIIDVLEAWYLRRDKPGIRMVLEHILLHNPNNDPEYHWSKGPYELTAKKYSGLDPLRIKEVMQSDFSGYIDAHCWKFTPESFCSVVNALYQIGAINFTVSKMFPTKRNTYEFYVILEKPAPLSLGN